VGASFGLTGSLIFECCGASGFAVQPAAATNSCGHRRQCVAEKSFVEPEIDRAQTAALGAVFSNAVSRVLAQLRGSIEKSMQTVCLLVGGSQVLVGGSQVRALVRSPPQSISHPAAIYDVVLSSAGGGLVGSEEDGEFRDLIGYEFALQALKAHESGVSNCVCFLTDITALQVEMLAALMATKHCDMVELFQEAFGPLFL